MRFIGIDNDGCLICEGDDGEIYNCGETLEQIGIENLSEGELEDINSGKYGPDYITLIMKY